MTWLSMDGMVEHGSMRQALAQSSAVGTTDTALLHLIPPLSSHTVPVGTEGRDEPGMCRFVYNRSLHHLTERSRGKRLLPSALYRNALGPPDPAVTDIPGCALQGAHGSMILGGRYSMPSWSYPTALQPFFGYGRSASG